jgi:hypothetical protein
MLHPRVPTHPKLPLLHAVPLGLSKNKMFRGKAR